MEPGEVSHGPRRCGRMAAWTTAWLRGRCTRGAAVDAIVGADALHTVIGWPGSEGGLSLADFLAELGEAGVLGLRYAPAAPGDVSALPGPPAFNARAVALHGACLTVGGPSLGLVGEEERHGPAGDSVLTVTWQAAPVPARPLPPVDLRSARRRLAEEVSAGLDRLYRLDVVKGRPEAGQLAGRWDTEVPAADLPPDSPAAAGDLLDRATRIQQVVTLARADDGGAVSSREAAQRHRTLSELDRAVRHVAADAWNCGLVDLGAPPRAGSVRVP